MQGTQAAGIRHVTCSSKELAMHAIDRRRAFWTPGLALGLEPIPGLPTCYGTEDLFAVVAIPHCSQQKGK